MKKSALLAIPALLSANLMATSANAQSFEAVFCNSTANQLCTADNMNFMGYGEFGACYAAIYAECQQAAVNDPDMSGNIGGRPGYGVPVCFVGGIIDSQNVPTYDYHGCVGGNPRDRKPQTIGG
jgi:hypothetical protein